MNTWKEVAVAVAGLATLGVFLFGVTQCEARQYEVDLAVGKAKAEAGAAVDKANAEADKALYDALKEGLR